MLVRAHWQTGSVPERDLLVLSEDPFNAETKLDEKTPAITPPGRHYVRTHFSIPAGPRAIVVEGASVPAISFDEIRALPIRSMVVTLECAGNGRRFLDPKAPGEQWGLGAVGTATWTGTSLRDVLGKVEIPPGTVELLFRGADRGVPKDLGRQISYERSLSIDEALRDDVLVAYLMEGHSIPREHGGPLRLIVPGWYGMASVKWLERITLLDAPFTGFFQKDRYVIDGLALRAIEPRAVIAWPVDGADVIGTLEVRGFAWSGRAAVDRVELSVDGRSHHASLAPPADAARFAWREFFVRPALEPGEHLLVARAIDRDGNEQPLSAPWNPLGYANNAVRPTRIRVRG
ncbi:MAG TPA: molybdopterin-dependent oxidoreductase [Candidatus Limnocylindria bacterium]|nr:molybdopterin-dependent oxidoreductase [Candidatus Limnocylindria bacterium]